MEWIWIWFQIHPDPLLTRVSERDTIGCGRRKILQVQSSINENISHLLGHNTDGIMPRTSQLPCEMCKDMDEMLNTHT